MTKLTIDTIKLKNKVTLYDIDIEFSLNTDLEADIEIKEIGSIEINGYYIETGFKESIFDPLAKYYKHHETEAAITRQKLDEMINADYTRALKDKKEYVKNKHTRKK